MRNYIVASWNDADQYDYSGEMLGGSRHAGRSQKVHFNPDGSACVASYGDPQPVKKVISLADRVLPQQRTLIKLIEQIKELEQAKRDGIYTQAEYDLLRDVLFAKKERAEYLLAKQRARKPASEQSNVGDDYTTITSNHYQIPVQNTGNKVKSSVGKACNSAKADLIYFVGGALALLVLVKVIF